MLTRNFFTALLALSFLSGACALADTVAGQNGESKENEFFDTDSEFELPDLKVVLDDALKAIKAITPEQGRVRVEFQELTGFSDAANNSTSYNVSLETYIFGTWDQTKEDHSTNFQ